MASVSRNYFVKETYDDRFWFANFNSAVVLLGGRMERQTYRHMTEKGTLDTTPVDNGCG